MSSVEQCAFHFSMPAVMVHKDSEEARRMAVRRRFSKQPSPVRLYDFFLSLSDFISVAVDDGLLYTFLSFCRRSRARKRPTPVS